MESGESEDNDPDRQRIGCQYPHHGVPPEGYDLEKTCKYYGVLSSSEKDI